MRLEQYQKMSFKKNENKTVFSLSPKDEEVISHIGIQIPRRPPLKVRGTALEPEINITDNSESSKINSRSSFMINDHNILEFDELSFLNTTVEQLVEAVPEGTIIDIVYTSNGEED